MMDTFKSGITLNPQSVSPVLKSNVSITLEPDFPYTLDKSDFSVNATSVTNSSYVRYLNVIDVDEDTKTLITKFGGAYSGDFQILIRHKNYGVISTAGLILTVGSTVTSFSPTQGSIYGGTLLTINGENFGNVYTDNPV